MGRRRIAEPVGEVIPERFRGRHRQRRALFHENPRTRLMGESAEVFGQRKDGSEFPLEISVSPLDTGDTKYVVSAIRDISGRKEAQAALQESEGRYRTLLDAHFAALAQLAMTTGAGYARIAADVDVGSAVTGELARLGLVRRR